MPHHKRYDVFMNDRYIGQLIHGNVEIMVLKVLSKGALHVYGIKKYVYDHSDGYFGLSEGRLYPLLKKFEKYGYVSSRPSISTTGRMVCEYSLTKVGRDELDVRMNARRIFAGKLNKVLDFETE